MKKSIFIYYLIIVLCSCSKNDESTKEYNTQSNFINVKNKIKEIRINEKDISEFGTPYVLSEYLIITDYKSPDKLIHLFNKNTFAYITSIGTRGKGPGEIASIGSITVDNKKNEFYVIDHGNQKIVSYNIDSILINPMYIGDEKATMNLTEFPSEFQLINDTLSLALFIKRVENGDYNPVVTTWNMNTGETKFMDYTGHPSIKRKRVSFATSIENNIYIEAYWHNDLMSICSIDEGLKYNLYGENWNERNTNEDKYYRNVSICKDKIIASYLGGKRLSENNSGVKVNYPTKLLVFDLKGNYISTLETEQQIITFCYDNENNRIIMTVNDEPQFVYLNLNDC